MWFIGVEVEQETSAPPPKKKSWIRPWIRQGNCKSAVWSKTERSFSNKEGEDNENVKRGMGLDISNSIFADATRFFFFSFFSNILFAVTARAPYFVKVPNFTFCGGREQTKTIFFSSPWTSIQSFKIEIQKKTCQDESKEME